jgi:CRP-like cAMP-binding protein
MLRKLGRRGVLDAADLEALGSLSYREKTYQAGSYLMREGTACEECALIIEGFTIRQKFTEAGRRQIVSFHIPGDFVDLEGSLLRIADHNVQALTDCEIVHFPVRELLALIDSNPRIGRTLWIDTLIDASIYREWLMNVGQRPAKQRIAHLLCEFALRLKLVGLGDEEGYRLPFTQEQLADATGLTQVHVNRSLKALDEAGLIERDGRSIAIPDWDRLRDSSGFSALYLHLDQVA